MNMNSYVLKKCQLRLFHSESSLINKWSLPRPHPNPAHTHFLLSLSNGQALCREAFSASQARSTHQNPLAEYLSVSREDVPC